MCVWKQCIYTYSVHHRNKWILVWYIFLFVWGYIEFCGLFNAKAILLEERLARGYVYPYLSPRVLVRKRTLLFDWCSISLITMLQWSTLATTPKRLLRTLWDCVIYRNLFWFTNIFQTNSPAKWINKQKHHKRTFQLKKVTLIWYCLDDGLDQNEYKTLLRMFAPHIHPVEMWK